MPSRLRALGGVLLAAVEAGLALLVLGTVAMLLELRAVYAAGASGEGTFVVGFLLLWLFAGGTATVVVGGHAVAVAARTIDRAGVAGLPNRFRRHAGELLGSAAVVAALLPTPLGGDPYLAALAASATFALGTLGHVTLDAVLGLRRMVAD